MRVQQTKLLSSYVKWQGHVDYVCAMESQRLHVLRMLKRAGVGPKDIVRISVSLVRSVLEYACQVWYTGLTVQESDQLEGLQRRALRIAYRDNSCRKSLPLTGLDTLHHRRPALSTIFLADMLKPSCKLHHLISPRNAHRYSLRFSRRNDSVL